MKSFTNRPTLKGLEGGYRIFMRVDHTPSSRRESQLQRNALEPAFVVSDERLWGSVHMHVMKQPEPREAFNESIACLW